jgi:hypothetical protein
MNVMTLIEDPFGIVKERKKERKKERLDFS